MGLSSGYILRDGQFYIDRTADPDADIAYAGDGLHTFANLKPIGFGLYSTWKGKNPGKTFEEFMVDVNKNLAMPLPDLRTGVEIPWPELRNGKRLYKYRVEKTLDMDLSTSWVLETDLGIDDTDFVASSILIDYKNTYWSYAGGTIIYPVNNPEGGQTLQVYLNVGQGARATGGTGAFISVSTGDWNQLPNSVLYLTLEYTKQSDPTYNSTAFIGGDGVIYTTGAPGKDGIFLADPNAVSYYMNNAMPRVGTIETMLGAVPNPGTLECDGRSVLRSDYPELFQYLIAIDPSYEDLDGLHFHLPDMNGEVIKATSVKFCIRYQTFDMLALQTNNVHLSYGGLGIPNRKVGEEFKTGRLRDDKIEYGYIYQFDRVTTTDEIHHIVSVGLQQILPDSNTDWTTVTLESGYVFKTDISIGGTPAPIVAPMQSPISSPPYNVANPLSSARYGVYLAVNTLPAGMESVGGYVVGALSYTTDWDVQVYLTYTKLSEGAAAVVPTVPAGTIWPFLLNSVPTGWLMCDGSTVYTADYPELATCAGMVDNGDGTFTMPDLRGQFLRGQDAAGTRALGSLQLDALQNITGSLPLPVASWSNQAKGYTLRDGAFQTTVYDRLEGYGAVTDYAALTVKMSASYVARTASETRPTNIAVMWCIKYMNTIQDDLLLASQPITYSDTWSATELPTGNTWFNKPTYRQVIQGVLGSDEAVDSLIASIPGATAIVEKYAQVQIGSDVYDSWTINSVSTPNSWDIKSSVDSSGINLSGYWTGYASYANAPVTISIEYIK